VHLPARVLEREGVTQRRPRAVLLPELEAVGPFQATSAAQSP